MTLTSRDRPILDILRDPGVSDDMAIREWMDRTPCAVYPDRKPAWALTDPVRFDEGCEFHFGKAIVCLNCTAGERVTWRWNADDRLDYESRTRQALIEREESILEDERTAEAIRTYHAEHPPTDPPMSIQVMALSRDRVMKHGREMRVEASMLSREKSIASVGERVTDVIRRIAAEAGYLSKDVEE